MTSLVTFHLLTFVALLRYIVLHLFLRVFTFDILLTTLAGLTCLADDWFVAFGNTVCNLHGWTWLYWHRLYHCGCGIVVTVTVDIILLKHLLLIYRYTFCYYFIDIVTDPIHVHCSRLTFGLRWHSERVILPLIPHWSDGIWMTIWLFIHGFFIRHLTIWNYRWFYDCLYQWWLTWHTLHDDIWRGFWTCCLDAVFSIQFDFTFFSTHVTFCFLPPRVCFLLFDLRCLSLIATSLFRLTTCLCVDTTCKHRPFIDLDFHLCTFIIDI